MLIRETEKEKNSNRAKYLSNSITISKNNVVPAVFTRYYSWLTNGVNLYNSTLGVLVEKFNIFGLPIIVDLNVPSSKDLYVKNLESIAYGIIRFISKTESLSVTDYIKYQITSLEKLFKVTIDKNNPDMYENFISLFKMFDLDKDKKLNVKDLAVSIAYLDAQDGVLDGNLRYEDAINVGSDIDTEIGQFRMKLELTELREKLYN